MVIAGLPGDPISMAPTPTQPRSVHVQLARATMIAVATACLAACSPSPQPVHPGSQHGQLVVRLEQTECMSGCPTYALELDDDGSVSWDGRDEVALKGSARGSMSQQDVAAVVAAFDRAGFFQLKRDLRVQQTCTGEGANRKCVTEICAMTDGTSLILTLAHGRRRHTIERMACESDELKRAIALFVTLAHARPWIGEAASTTDAPPLPRAK
jgi:hypothetical protein